jgi:hypothetical protein
MFFAGLASDADRSGARVAGLILGDDARRTSADENFRKS